MSEVIRIVEKFNAAQQLSALLRPSMVSMIPNDDECFVCGQTGPLATPALMCSVSAVMNLATLHKTVPTRFHHQDHHATKTGLIQGHDIPTTPEGTDHIPSTMGTYMGDISTDHKHTTIPTMTGVAAVPQGTHHAPHPTTTAACAAIWLMDASIAKHTMTHHTDIVIPHPTLTTSPTNVTHTTKPQTRAGLTLATITT